MYRHYMSTYGIPHETSANENAAPTIVRWLDATKRYPHPLIAVL